MTDHQNFKNGDNHFNIFLNDNGDLEFNANGDSGGGDTRMVISNEVFSCAQQNGR